LEKAPAIAAKLEAQKSQLRKALLTDAAKTMVAEAEKEVMEEVYSADELQKVQDCENQVRNAVTQEGKENAAKALKKTKESVDPSTKAAKRTKSERRYKEISEVYEVSIQFEEDESSKRMNKVTSDMQQLVDELKGIQQQLKASDQKIAQADKDLDGIKGNVSDDQIKASREKIAEAEETLRETCSIAHTYLESLDAKKIVEAENEEEETEEVEEEKDEPPTTSTAEPVDKRTKGGPDWNADKIARKLADAPEIDPDLDIAALRAKARGAAMSDEEKKARGLLYDTSKASAVREESEEDEDDDACDFGGDPFEGM